MNKKFLSAILFGALMVSSTGTFVSCKDYDDDIDQINNKISGIESTIADLQKKIGDGAYVKAIAQTAAGFTVTMSDGSTTPITGIKGDKGEAGKDGTEWTIVDGYWACNGEKTDVKAVGVDGESAQKEVEKRADGWYLWNGTEFEKVTVDTPAAAGVPFYQIDPKDENYAIMHIYDETGKNEKSIRLPLNEGLAQLAVLNETRDLRVYYSIATNAKDLQAWEGPKGAPAKGSYMITASADSLMVQVTPTNYDLSGDELQLVNSKNEVAPVTLGKAVAYNGLYTRAASVNGMFKIPFSIETITDEIVEAYPNVQTKRPALSLVASDKVRSTYETTLAIQKQTSTVDFSRFYVNKKEENGVISTNNFIEPGKTGTLKAWANADKLYDAFLTVEDGYKADSIKYGIKTNGLTISCDASAKDHYIPFRVHTLDVAGNVSHTSYTNVGVFFGEESTTSTSEFETQNHTATGDTEKQNLLVDFAPYFKDMSTADRILWNSDASMNLRNTNVDWVYTDESTGKEVTVEGMSGLIASIQMAKVDGTVTTNKADFAKLLITFNTNYNNSQFKGAYTAKVTVNYNNNVETISIPFEIASPTDAEIAKQYAYNPAYYNATSKVFTVPSATSVDLTTLIAGNIDYADAKVTDADKDKLTLTGSTAALVDPTDFNKAYTVEGLKVNYLGNQFDIPAIKVQFIQFKNYKFTTTNTLTFQSGKAASNATVLYGKAPDKTKDAYYNLTTILGDNVAAADVTINGIEFTSPLATEDGSALLTASVDDNTKNIVLNFTGKKTTEDSTVAIKVTATVNGEEIEGIVTVKIKKYPTE